MLVMQPNELQVLISLEDWQNMPQPGEARGEWSRNVTYRREVSSVDAEGKQGRDQQAAHLQRAETQQASHWKVGWGLGILRAATVRHVPVPVLPPYQNFETGGYGKWVGERVRRSCRDVGWHGTFLR